MAEEQVSADLDMVIAPDLIAALWDCLEREAPNEACGVLTSNDNGILRLCHPLMNYAPDKTKEFWMLPTELHPYLNAWPTLALWHSHPTERWNLSRQDRQVMVTTHLPMVIVAAKPYPSVVLYEFQGHEIVQTQRYAVEGVTV